MRGGAVLGGTVRGSSATTRTRSRRRRSLAELLALLAMVALAAVFFLPLIWMVASSFKSNADIFAHPFRLPQSIDPGRWAEAWRAGNLGRSSLWACCCRSSPTSSHRVSSSRRWP